MEAETNKWKLKADGWFVYVKEHVSDSGAPFYAVFTDESLIQGVTARDAKDAERIRRILDSGQLPTEWELNLDHWMSHLGLESWVTDGGKRIHYKSALQQMDPVLREEVHEAHAPCSRQWFLWSYRSLHAKRLGTPFELTEPRESRVEPDASWLASESNQEAFVRSLELFLSYLGCFAYVRDLHPESSAIVEEYILLDPDTRWDDLPPDAEPIGLDEVAEKILGCSLDPELHREVKLRLMT